VSVFILFNPRQPGNIEAAGEVLGNRSISMPDIVKLILATLD
jgi:hypothetical protein